MATPGALDPALHAELGFYVYALCDPRDGSVFYIGMGQKDRVLDHDWEASNSASTNLKVERIRSILAERPAIEKIIIRRRMSEATAREVEAALIDTLPHIGMKLTNLVRGAEVERGLRSLDALRHEFAAPYLVDVAHPTAIVVNINNTWYEGMPADELWEMSRSWWRCRPDCRRSLPILLLSVAQKIVRGAWTLDPTSLGAMDRPDWADLGPVKQRFFYKDDQASFQASRFEAWRFDGIPSTDSARFMGCKFTFPPRNAFVYLDSNRQAVA